MRPRRTEQPRRRISARQRPHLLERFQSSGLTRIAFARRYILSLPTLGKWLSEARAASPRPSPVVFREVRLTGVKAGNKPRKSAEGPKGASIPPEWSHGDLNWTQKGEGRMLLGEGLNVVESSE